MKSLNSINSKILSLELRLRYILKNLTFRLKVLFLILLSLFLLSGFILLYEIDDQLSIKVPTEGGILREGIIGTPRFVNPVLAMSDPDRDLIMLIYSGLLRAVGNELIPDLAKKYEVSEDGLCYTFTLKPDLFWSNEIPITSDDILFTIDLIKKPATKSPKRASWEGVSAEKIDDKTIRFCLSSPYAPFLENTTLGILPQHVWQDLLPDQIPLSTFNIEPIGSGPYKIEKITRNSSGIITSYTLSPNKYFSLQKPYLKKVILKFYPSEQKLIEAYEKNEIDNLSAVSPQKITEIQKRNSYLKTYQLPRVFAVFLNQDSAPIFANKEVREALNFALDKELVVKDILKDFGITINSPIPPGSLGYLNISPEQKDPEELLAKNDWKLNEEGILEKKTKSAQGRETLRLEFSLSTSNIPDLIQTAQLLKEMWEKIGAKVNVKIYEIGDLEQNVIRPRKYDALLFGEILGRDPDAFAFWHSSQRNDPGLNIALYTNIKADKLLEEARTSFNQEEREQKYKEFQEEIAQDTPAVFLYSPYYIHLIPEGLQGIDLKTVTVSSERFSQIYNWYLNTKKIWKIFED